MLYYHCKSDDLCHGKNMDLGLLNNKGMFFWSISDHIKALVDTKVLNEIEAFEK
jgi:hypothetical protein